MTSRKKPQVYLQDILDAIEKIGQYTQHGKRCFMSDPMIQDAVIRQLSIMGEASGKLPTSLRNEYSTVPWKNIIGMRNIIIHEYADIDLPIIWDTIHKGLPPLQIIIQHMLTENSGE